jgi:putative phosphoribosyl transferase
MGAIGEGGVRVLDRRLLADAGIGPDELEAVEARERSELEARLMRYRRGRPPIPLAGRVVVVVDDGLATGATARAACEVARQAGATTVVLAVPVAAPESLADLDDAQVADEVVALTTPRPFLAVGHHYRDFTPTSDDEVVDLLDAAARRPSDDATDHHPPEPGTSSR